MKRMLSLLALTGVFAATMFGTASASVASGGTFSDGPYTSTSPDSGTCGNNWAIDLFNRTFVVTLPASGGVYTMKETFSKGHFNTMKGASPEACGAGTHGATIAEGVSGTMGGSFTIMVSDGTFDPNGSCVLDGDAQCTTAGWVAGFFGPTATYAIPQYSFKYTAKKQGLMAGFKSWTNADTGDIGDIATA